MKRLTCWLLAAMCLFSGSRIWATPNPRYTIEARLDLPNHIISGDEIVSFTNPTHSSLTRLYFFLFPNVYRDKNPALNEMNYRWHYPSNFDSGWLEIGSVREDGSERPLSVEAATPNGLARGTVVSIPLEKPIGPGEQVTLRIGFRCKVPHKYGPFGHYRNTYTLQGGWHPYLVALNQAGQPEVDAAPEPASFQIRLQLSAPHDVLLNGRFFHSMAAVSYETPSARMASLIVSPQFFVSTERVRDKTVTYYRLSKDRYVLGEVMQSFATALGALPAEAGTATASPLIIVETYLRAVMSYPAENMLLLSDRYMVTVESFDLRNLNRLEIARAMAFQQDLDGVGQREDPVDVNWVAETLAWAFRNNYLRSHFPKMSNLRQTAGRMGMFRPFNRLAASPTIPFSETYVGFTPLRDNFRESLFYFSQNIPSGEVFAEKLQATVGDSLFERIVQGYLNQPRDFPSWTSEVVGRDMSWFFRQWKQGYPSNLDYALTSAKLNQRADGGGYRTSFTIDKTGGEHFVEPVEVQVNKQHSPPSRLAWEANTPQKTFEVTSPEKVKLIEIDPESKTVQTNDYNDLAPHRWQAVIDRGEGGVGSGGLSAALGIRMHKVRDQGKWLFIVPFISPAELGTQAGARLDFGGQVDGLVWARKQEVSLAYVFSNLRSDFAARTSGKVDNSGQAAGFKFGYTYKNKMFEEDPMNFDEVNVTAAFYRKELGGDFNFFQSTLAASKAVALRPADKLAGVVFLGYSDGYRHRDVVPTQKQFDLANISFLELANFGEFLAKNTLASSLEWRHDLMSDLDMKMPMENRVRRLQGAAGFDVAWLNDRFGNLFRLNQAVYGVRYGLRVHYDFFGVRPSDFRVDVGYRIGDGPRPGGSRVVFSLALLQSF